MADETQQTDNTQPDPPASPDPQIVSRAREMGWVPKEEFRGDQSKWVDASLYVERGENVLPIVQSQNRNLRSEVSTLRNQLAEAQRREEEIKQSVLELQQFSTEISKDRMKQNRSTIAQRIKAAREAGDVELELELQEELNQSKENTQPPVVKTTPATPPRTAAPQVSPAQQAWMSQNPWFGQPDHARQTNYAIAVAQDLVRANPALANTPELFSQVDSEVRAVFSPQTRSTSKVEGGNGSSRSPAGSGEEKGKSFADLPADAQAVARKQVSRFVGKGKLFSDEAAWFKHYTKLYFE